MKTDRKIQPEKAPPKLKAAKKTPRGTPKTNGKHPLVSYEHIPIGLVECSPEGKYVDVNEEFCRITGYTRTELLRQDIKDLTHEDDYSIDVKLHESLVAGKIPFYRLEKRYMRKEGGSVWVELTRSVVRDEEGKALYTIGVVLDISERKHAERVLRESVERLRLATEAAQMFTWEWDFQNNSYSLSDSFTQVLGFSTDLLSKNGFETLARFIPQEDIDATAEAFIKAVEAKKDLHSLQCRVINHEKGQTVWLEISAKIVYDYAGQAERMFGVAQNITRDKQKEEALRESEERFRALVSQATAGITQSDMNSALTFVNPRLCEMLGYSESELLGKTIWELTYPDDLEENKRLFKRMLEHGESYQFEKRFIRKDGSTLWTNVSVSTIRDLYGKSKGGVGVVIDIEERKQAEAGLTEYARQQTALYKLSNQLHRTVSLEEVFNAALEAILSALQCDRASILLYDDAEVMRFVAWHGLSNEYRKATDGHSPWRPDAKDPEPIQMDDIRTAEVGEELRTVIQQEGIGALAFVPLISNGKLIGKFMIYFNAPHRFDEAELDLSLTIARQLASGIERKRAEDALRIRARQQQAVARLGELAVRERDLQKLFDHATAMITGTLEIEYCKVLELVEDKTSLLLRSGIGWQEGLVGSARVDTGPNSQAGYILQSDTPVVVLNLLEEQRFNGPPLLGQHGIISGMSCIIRAANGQPWGVLGAHTTRQTTFTEEDVNFLTAVSNILGDAIQRQESEQALRQSEERYRAVVESQAEMLCRFQPDGKLLFVNGAYARARGATPEALIHRSFWEFIPEEDQPEVRAMLDTLTPQAPEVQIENRFQTADGERWILWTNRGLKFDAGQRLLEAQSSGIDVTARKHAEKRLSLLAEISELIREMEDPHELLYVVSRKVGEYLQVKRALFNEIDIEHDRETVHRDYYNGVPSVAGMHKLSDYSSIASAEMQTGKTVVNMDSKLDPRTARDYEKTYGPNRERAYIAIPLMRENRWVASLWVSDDLPRTWSLEDVSLLETIAERTWTAVEKLKFAEELRAKEAELEEIINQTPFMLTRCTRDLRYRFVSRAYAEMIGRTPEEVADRPIIEIMGEEGLQTISPYVEQVLAGNQVEYEAEVAFREVNKPFLHVVYTPDRDEQGNVIGWFGSIVDISDRKQIEEALRRNEKMFSTLIDAAPFGVYFIDSEFRLRAINKGSEAVFSGIDPLIGRDFAEILRIVWNEPFATEAIERFRHTLRTGESFISPPVIEERANIDDIQAYDWQIHRITLSDGTFGVVCYFYDLSEQKKMEATARASETLYRTIARNIPGGGVYVVDKDYRYLVAEGAVTEAFGLSREMLEGRTIAEVFPDEQGARMEARLRRTFAGETVDFETQLNGRVYWTQQAPLQDAIGQAIILTIDITERLRAEEALRESEERFSAILRQATAGIVRKDNEGRLLFVNQAFCNMLGYTEDELIGKTIWDFMHAEDIAENKRSYDRLLAEGIPFKLERRLLRGDGSVIWVDASVSPIMDARGKPQSAVTVEVDITGRKEAEEALHQLNLQLEERVLSRTAKLREVNQALREEIAERKRVEEALRQSETTARTNEEKLSTLFDLLPVGISFLDPQGKIIQMNSALPNILRLSKEQLLNQAYTSRSYIRADGMSMSPFEFASARALAEEKTVYNVETGIPLENGEVVWTNVSAAPVNVAGVGAVVVTVDTTDSKRAERALQESHRRLRILSQRLVEVQEDERRALARELHDRVGQTLAALNINLIIINSQLSAEVAEQIGTRLNDSMKLVAETIALVRDVMTDLRPSVLDDYGLEAALESHLAQFVSRYNISTRLEKPDQPLPRLGPSIEMTFLRIAQEALMNIARHAQATEVRLSLRREENTIGLTIQDNGIGIESWQEANRPGSHGLTIMRERAEAFDGSLQVRSVPGQGTIVELKIPFTNDG